MSLAQGSPIVFLKKSDAVSRSVGWHANGPDVDSRVKHILYRDSVTDTCLSVDLEERLSFLGESNVH